MARSARSVRVRLAFKLAGDPVDREETDEVRGLMDELAPPIRRTGSDLRRALAETLPPDGRFAADIADALGGLAHEGTTQLPGCDVTRP